MTPIVNADAATQPKDSTVDGDTTTSSSTSDDESLSDEQQVKKKQKREKVGFRDRKVNFHIHFDIQQKLKSRQISEKNRIQNEFTLMFFVQKNLILVFNVYF